MRKANKVIAGVLSALMVLSATPVFAASTGSVASDKTAGEDAAQGKATSYQQVAPGDYSTDVYLTVDDSELLVGIPTTAILSGTPDKDGKNKGQYSIEASGDMAADKELIVEPASDTFKMSQKGKKDVDASIVQEKRTFSSEELSNGASADGEISAILDAGIWHGEFAFNIEKADKNVPKGYTILYQYDLSATTNDEVAAYYCVPNKNTQPIEPVSTYSLRAAADTDVVENNGIRYELSDEDTLVISGQGNMKENIQADLIDYVGLYEAVSQNFNLPYEVGEDVFDVFKNHQNNEPFIFFTNNSMQARLYQRAENIGVSAVSRELEISINQYIDSIKENYVLSYLKTVVIKDGVSNISNNAFNNCQTLTTVDIPASVTSIGENAFYRCSALESISIPSSVTSIGKSAFYSCSNLSTVNIAKGSLTSIGESAFSWCSKLESVNIPDSVTDIGNKTFYMCKNLTTAHLSNNLKSIGEQLFFYCNKLKQVNIPDVSSIGDHAFCNCNQLAFENLTIPESVTSIGESAFSSCSSITGNIIIPESVTSIGKFAFSGCSKITHISIPNNITAIADGTFQSCAITEIEIPAGVTYIGNSAFSNCTRLESINIPDGVTSIGKDAFRVCSSLKQISIPDSVTSIGQYAFSSCNSLTQITIPDSITAISDGLFYTCSNLSEINMPNTITSIGKSAFYNCSSLKHISLPYGVTTIGKDAFSSNRNLESIAIPSSVTSIGGQFLVDTNANVILYCQSQSVADLLSRYTNRTIIVDPSMF